MPSGRSAGLVLALALLAVPAGSRAEDAPAPGPASAPAAPMLVLSRVQLLDTPGGFPEACKELAKSPRSHLRALHVGTLKTLAETARPGLVEACGNPKDVRPLWLLNGIVCPLTPDQVKAARAHEAVLDVLPAGALPPSDGPGPLTARAGWPLRLDAAKKPVPEPDFDPTGKEIPWHLTELRVPEVWKRGVTGEGVLLLHFDAGIDYRHPDLVHRIAVNEGEVAGNGKDDDGNGLADDVQGWDFARNRCDVLDTGKRQHGTITASLAVGDGSAGVVTGVAPRARLLPVIGRGGIYNAVRTLQYGLERGADICTMSFSIRGDPALRSVWRRLAENATLCGLLLVSGAGNNGTSLPTGAQIQVPEGIPCVLAVGGVTRKRTVPDFVSRGPVEWGSAPHYRDHPLPGGLVKPDVVTFPGPGLRVAFPGAKAYLPADNRRAGNSLSAPLAAGVAALLLSAKPETPPWVLRDILERTARDLPPAGKDNQTGGGLLDALAAFEALKGE